MPQLFFLREQAERCRRLARDSTDLALRNSLVRLAEEYTARADAQENEEENQGAAVWRAGRNPDDSAS
jgi:hypothetical protein